MQISPNDISKILDHMERNMALYIASGIGPEYLNADQKPLVKNQNLYRPENDIVFTNFVLGQLSQIIGYEATKRASYQDLIEHIQKRNFLPLNPSEKDIIDTLKRQHVKDIQKLTNKVEEKISQEILNESLNQQRVAERVVQELKNQKSVIKIANELNKEMSGYTRDYRRSVEYMTSAALNRGNVATIERIYGDDPLMIVDTMSGACKDCNRLYNQGGKPKIFRLSELKTNGTNIGRKREAWLPVISPAHNFCRCLTRPYQGRDLEQPKISRPKIEMEFNGRTYKV